MNSEQHLLSPNKIAVLPAVEMVIRGVWVRVFVCISFMVSTGEHAMLCLGFDFEGGWGGGCMGSFHRWKMVWNPDSIPYIFHLSLWKWNGIFHISYLGRKVRNY